MIWNRKKEYEKLKYEFVTIIAHKFRTPLSQIRWLLEDIKAKEQDPYIKESLLNIDGSNQKLIGLTNTLIELTDSDDRSLATYSFQKINICEVTSQIVSALKVRFHEKNLFTSIQCSNPEIFVKADMPRIEFVLQTIMENSINYSPPGKNVDISITAHGHRAIIQITDHGIGIDKSDLSNIFEKFFRADNAQKMDTEGFGVGLFLAQSIVRKHRGKIEVASLGLSQGSTFTVSLPLSR